MSPLNVLSPLTSLSSLSAQSCVENWTMTKWRQINVDQMDAELRRFAKVRSPTAFHHTSASLLLSHCHAPLLLVADAP